MSCKEVRDMKGENQISPSKTLKTREAVVEQLGKLLGALAVESYERADGRFWKTYQELCRNYVAKILAIPELAALARIVKLEEEGITENIERIDLLMDELSLVIPALVAGDSIEECTVGNKKPYEYVGKRKGNEVTITIKINE